MIRKGLADQLSWKGKARFSNMPVIEAIADAIVSLEGDKHGSGKFIEKYLGSLNSISTFNELWRNFDQTIWNLRMTQFLRYQKEQKESEKKLTYERLIGIYKEFVEDLLFLPVQLLQYKSTRKYLDEIYDKLLEKISSKILDDQEKRGHFFEALHLIDKMRTKSGRFQFFLNGVVVTDASRPAVEQDANEFDVIELLINEKGNAECWIYACSIADNYESKNQDQITKITKHIHKTFQI